MAFELELRQFSVVRRWATRRTTRDQTLSDHSFYVCLYATQIADLLGWPGDRSSLTRVALLHDVDELASGDLPGTWKNKLPGSVRSQVEAAAGSFVLEWFPWLMHDPAPGVASIVRCADALEAALFAAEEIRYGNPDFGVVMTDAVTRLERTINELPGDDDHRNAVWHGASAALSRHRNDSPKAAR